MAAVARSGVSRPALDLFCRVDQVLQRFFRSPSQLTSEQKSDHAAPPPGRAIEVSIEADERAAFLVFGQRDVLVIVDAERQVHEKIDPS